MFKRQSYQKNITAYFKPVGISQRKRVNTIKIDALLQCSSTAFTASAACEINSYQMLRFTVPDAEKISFRFISKITAEKISETTE